MACAVIETAFLDWTLCIIMHCMIQQRAFSLELGSGHTGIHNVYYGVKKKKQWLPWLLIGPSGGHPLLILQQPVCYPQQFGVRCIRVSEQESVVKVVTVGPF